MGSKLASGLGGQKVQNGLLRRNASLCGSDQRYLKAQPQKAEGVPRLGMPSVQGTLKACCIGSFSGRFSSFRDRGKAYTARLQRAMRRLINPASAIPTAF